MVGHLCFSSPEFPVRQLELFSSLEVPRRCFVAPRAYFLDRHVRFNDMRLLFVECIDQMICCFVRKKETKPVSETKVSGLRVRLFRDDSHHMETLSGKSLPCFKNK